MNELKNSKEFRNAIFECLDEYFKKPEKQQEVAKFVKRNLRNTRYHALIKGALAVIAIVLSAFFAVSVLKWIGK